MTIRNSTRNRLLAGVGTTVLATAIVSGVHAAEIGISDTLAIDVRGSQTITGTLDLLNPLNENDAAVSATISGVSAGITRDGTQSGVTEAVSDNLINASATGNRFTNTIDLSLIQNGANDGAASLGFARNFTVDPDGGEARVRSLVEDSAFFIDDTDFQSGSVTATGNTISAVTTVNEGSTVLSGDIPTSFVSATAGSSSVSFPVANVDGDLFASSGTLVSATIQQNLEAGHDAVVTGNSVVLSLEATDDFTLNGSPALDDNTISAALRGNASTSTIGILSGDSPSFTGSAVVTNLQLNATDEFSSSSAVNAGSLIAATISGDAADALYELEGGLSVSGNRISSSLTGNEALGAANGAAGNQILLGDNMSIYGAGGAAAGAGISYTGGGIDSTVTADLIIHNSQGNQGVSDDARQSLSASTSGGQIIADVQSIEGGAIAQSANRMTSTITGNAASSALRSGENSVDFDATVAVANQQTNDNTDLSATNTGAMIATITGSGGGVTQESSIAVTGNRISASGYGNEVSQVVDLAANDLLTGSGNVALTGGTASQGNVSASGDATISNLHSGYASNLTVSNIGSTIGIDADSQQLTAPGNTIAGSTLTTGSNSQEAIALANSAGNSLSLFGTNVGSGAGIGSVQILDDNSAVSATLQGASAGVVASSHVADSSISVTGNTQRAIGYGASVSNALSVEANGIELDGADASLGGDLASVITFDPFNTLPFSNGVGEQPVVNAAYGILNDQSTQADVSATANAGTSGGIGITVEGALADSSAMNDLNSFVAAAYGNDAGSAISLYAGNLEVDGDGGAVVANVTSTQALDAAVSATATGGNVISTYVDDLVSDSSISTSDNVIQALAFGNRATGNSVSVTGTNVDASGASRGGVSLDYDDLEITANASFSVQNAQSAQGSILASQVDNPASPALAAGILVSAGVHPLDPSDVSDIVGSSISADTNRSFASATGNSAANSLSIDVNSLAVTSGMQNVQSTGADIAALIGAAGTVGSPGTSPDTFGIAVTAEDSEALDGIVSGGSVTLTGGTLLFPTASLTSEQITYLTNNGWTIVGSNISGPASLLGSIPIADYATLQGGGTANLSYTIPGTLPTAGTPNQGGVTIAAGAGIIDSSLSVAANIQAGSVTGNSAINSLDIAASTIAAGGTLATSTAGDLSLDVTGAVADHALANFQEVLNPDDDISQTATVYGTLAIDAAEDVAITDSSLTISGNSQSATAVSNTAANGISLEGTGISAGSALSSDQWSAAEVGATSNLEIFTSAAVSGSSVVISDNQNTALGVINDVTNTLSVTGTNFASVDAVGEVVVTGDWLDDTWLATGDHVVTNRQTAFTEATSSAVTQLYNEDRVATETSGLVDSSLTITGNRTVSEAGANRADNRLTLQAASTLGANGGIVNRQDSDATVSASSTTLAVISLAGDEGLATPALSSSSVTLDGNSTTALARGNSATNILNAVAGSNYAGSAAGAGSTLTAGGASSEVRAGAAVLNGQVNTGNVSATSVATVYAVALNGAVAGDPAMANGSVSVSGNQVATEAYGNSAVNRVSLTGLSTGTSTAAVGSHQVNSGAITASVTQASLGIGGTGSVGGSSLGVRGNTISANAVGNTVSNAIRRN